MSYRPGKINVMVIDQSAVIRKTLKEIISSDVGLNFYAAAAEPAFAMQNIHSHWPDVLILDVMLPKKAGLNFLQKIMSEHPMPVIICTSLENINDISGLKALASGALDIIHKPPTGTRAALLEKSEAIIKTIKKVTVTKRSARIKREYIVATSNVAPRLNADEILEISHNQTREITETIVAIGTSTGGTQALEQVLTNLKNNCPGIVIVQHMPEHFTEIFAQRLNMMSQIEVLEAKNGDKVKPGQALIAPGGKHMMLKRQDKEYYVKVIDGPLVNRHKPSVDVLFRSVANCAGKNAVGIIMTGMGDDGAQGLSEMHGFGAFTIGQDKASSVVYGMPKEAHDLGAVEIQVPLQDIASQIMRFSEKRH